MMMTDNLDLLCETVLHKVAWHRHGVLSIQGETALGWDG